MLAMFPDFYRLESFSAHKRVYRPSAKVRASTTRTKVPDAPSTVGDDSMEVDDDNSPDILLPSHALDSLHLQIIEHFRGLLQNLALRNGAPTAAIMGTARSAHAPKLSTKPCYEWTAAEVLEYLNLKRPLPSSNPPLELFMSLPYSTRGARRGQDWPRRAWEEALAALAQLGRQWAEGSIAESVSVLPFHCERIFSTPMRPTGM
jgi:hypothetical protein